MKTIADYSQGLYQLRVPDEEVMRDIAAQGFRYDPEVTQTSGRSDLIAEHPCGIYVFELKVDESAEAALAQIKEKDYAAPYRARNLPVWAIGLSLDSKTRHLTGAVHERLV